MIENITRNTILLPNEYSEFLLSSSIHHSEFAGCPLCALSNGLWHESADAKQSGSSISRELFLSGYVKRHLPEKVPCVSECEIFLHPFSISDSWQARSEAQPFPGSPELSPATLDLFRP